MMTHENIGVRKIVLHHLTNLLRANRSLFRQFIESEEVESMRFLTVVNSNSNRHPYKMGADEVGIPENIEAHRLKSKVANIHGKLRDIVSVLKNVL